MRNTRPTKVTWLAMAGLLAACGSMQSTPSVAPSATGASFDESACVGVELGVCAEVTAAAVHNLAGNEIAFRPPATVVQGACPERVPDYADPTTCWYVTLPLAGGGNPQVIMARRYDGVVAQVGGDSISGAALPDD